MFAAATNASCGLVLHHDYHRIIDLDKTTG